MNDSCCCVVLFLRLITEHTSVQEKHIFLSPQQEEADVAMGQTKALVVNGNTWSFLGPWGAMVGWHRHTPHTKLKHEPRDLNPANDVIWEGENNQHFVTTKQNAVSVSPDTQSIAGSTVEKKTMKRLKQSKEHGTVQDRWSMTAERLRNTQLFQ